MKDRQVPGHTPEWLANLSPLNRARARQWLADVGEARFTEIARVALTQKRANNRPREDDWPAVLEAAIEFFSTPGLSQEAAAKAAAQRMRLSASPSSRWLAMTEARLRRIMREGLSLDSLTTDQAIAAMDELERRGLALRPDFSSRVSSVGSMLATLQMATLTVSAQPVHVGNSTYRTNPRATAISQQKRVSHLLTAIDGLVPGDTPVSRVIAAFQDLLSVLQSES